VSIATKYGILQHILCVALGGKSSSVISITSLPGDEQTSKHGGGGRYNAI
jgi:hypothetical protein